MKWLSQLGSVRLAVILVGFPAASLICHAWSSKDLPLFDPVHQQAIDAVLNGAVNDADRAILKEQQAVVDEDQDPAQSFEHSMTGVEKGQSDVVEKPLYVARTEKLVHDLLLSAIQARKTGHVPEALVAVGKVMHALEDATSPAHELFQPWRWDESYWQIAVHVSKERSYPSDQRRQTLEGAVRWVFAIYMEQSPLPDRFFDGQGALLLPSGFLSVRR